MRRKRTFLLGFLFLFTLAWGSAAQAGFFGTSETLRPLGEAFEVPGKGRFVLAQKVTRVDFLLGVWVSDDGYVLAASPMDGRYLKAEPELLRALQDMDLLPPVLPSHGLGLLDYLFGFSLWIMLAYYGIKDWLSRNHVRFA